MFTNLLSPQQRGKLLHDCMKQSRFLKIPWKRRISAKLQFGTVYRISTVLLSFITSSVQDARQFLASRTEICGTKVSMELETLLKTPSQK